MTTEHYHIDKQALSAAPAQHNASRALQGLDFIMRVYEPCMGKSAPDEEMAVIVEATKRLLFGWWGEHRDTVRAALAASPTPPAEQQAASSAVLKAIREANMQLVRTGDDAFMLVPYKVATAEQAAPKAAPGEPYQDSTPHLSVGDSSFEGWYESYYPAHKSDKQRARDAYAAGMGDPLVRVAPHPAPAPLSEPVERALVWSGTMWGRSDEVNEDDALELIRAVEMAHNITQKGGSNADA